VVEGSGAYGKGLARFLQRAGETVFELERPRRRGAGGRLKSDPLDALRAARALLAGEQLARPRAGGEREALRCLLRSRESAVEARRRALNQLRALIVVCPEPLRGELRQLSRARLLARCRAFRSLSGQDVELAGTRLAMRLLARRVALLAEEERALRREIDLLVERVAPGLIAQPGVGPISAAEILVCWSHAGRLRSEAAFARLAGAAPIPASSGQVVRQRLDRGGDRRLNRALHQIVVCRRRHHRQTIAYVERRLAEGKSSREATRCLKRYVARSLFRLLEAMPAPA